MKFSIIVATYNSEKTLKRCIDSVYQQTYTDRELIIIDGNSKDKTVEILKTENAKIQYWVSESDRGIYDAFNKALKQAKGDWIIFLGSDDFFIESDVLSRIAPLLQKAISQYKVVYGRVSVVSSTTGECLQVVGQPWSDSKKLIRHELSIPHQGTFHHKSLFEIYGNFDTSFKITGDYDFLLRELKNHDALYIEDPIISAMQIGGLSSLLENTITNLNELARARKNNGVTEFSYPLHSRLFRAKLRRSLNSLIGEKATHWIADTYRVMTGKPRIWTKTR